MAIDFNCQHCGWTAKLDGGYAGQSGRCPRCSNAIVIPPFDRRATRLGHSRDGDAASLPWQRLAGIVLHPCPCALAAVHLVIMLIWVPLALATVNTEAAPLGAGVITWIDPLANWVWSDWLEPFLPAYPWSVVWVVVGFPFIFGTLHWYAIGLLPLIGFRFTRSFRRTMFPNTMEERVEDWTSRP